MVAAASAAAAAAALWLLHLRRRGVFIKSGLCPARLRRITEYVQRQVEHGHAPMMKVSVLRRGNLVFEAASGYSRLERKTPLSDDTIMRIYSLSKPIVAVATMILVERAEIQRKAESPRTPAQPSPDSGAER